MLEELDALRMVLRRRRRGGGGRTTACMAGAAGAAVGAPGLGEAVMREGNDILLWLSVYQQRVELHECGTNFRKWFDSS